eukprot:gene3082-3547_t
MAFETLFTTDFRQPARENRLQPSRGIVATAMAKKEPFVFIPNLNEVVAGSGGIQIFLRRRKQRRSHTVDYCAVGAADHSSQCLAFYDHAQGAPHPLGPPGARSDRLRLRYSTAGNTYYRDYEDTINPKTTNKKANWDSVTYESNGVQQFRNETHDELYLGRQQNHDKASISWKFDFSASGLVVDVVHVKVETVQTIYNKLELTVEGNNSKVSTDLREEVNHSRFEKFEGSSELLLKISMVACRPGFPSKLFLQSTAARRFDCPLDINIRLKRPSIAAGRSLLLLGLMYSSEQHIDLRKRPWRRRPQDEMDKGFLYIHIYKAKRLPTRITGTMPDPQVKCKLMLGDRGLTCKTMRVRKSVNPVWDEQHVIEGISPDVIKSAKLEIKVMHDVLSFNKRKRREVLGTSTIQKYNQLELNPDDEDFAQQQQLQQQQQSHFHNEVSNWSCTKLNESDRCIYNCRKSSFEEDIIDLLMSGSDNKSGSSFQENFDSDSCLSKNISVSLTSLQSTAKDSISEINDKGNTSWKSSLKWKGFGRVLGHRITRPGSKNDTNLMMKRPSIVLSNSQETIVVLHPENNGITDEDLKSISSDETTMSENEDSLRSRSYNNLMLVGNRCNSGGGECDERRSTLTPISMQNVGDLLEPFAQLQQTAKLASAHWDKLSEHKDKWLYCWHPLTLR